MTDDLFAGQPWLTDFSGVEGLPPGMLGHPEASMLHRVARDYYRGYGEIIDAGAFLGASSFCLAKGLDENAAISRKSGRIHAYDIFQVWNEPGQTDADMANWLRNHYGIETAGYESTVGIYTANLGPLARHVRVHQGDFMKAEWSGRPIEILFVDICKTKALWQHVLRTLYPSLIPGVSLVIHQDWHHPSLPYLHVAQEALSDYFEILVPKASDSSAFRLVDRIPERVLEDVAEYPFSPGEEQRLIASAVRRFEGNNRFVKLAQAELMRQQGRFDQASQIIHNTVAAHGEPVTEQESIYFRAWAGGLADRVERESGMPHPADFDEPAYMNANADVAGAVAAGHYRSGLHHWYRHGRWEGREPAWGS